MDGLAAHWAVMTPQADHARCAGQFRTIAGQHGDPESLYSHVYCDHGPVLGGRGWDRRSGATCNSFWNARYWSACWIGGPGHRPSPAALATLTNLRAEAVRRGGRALIGHQEACATACPGPDLMEYVRTHRDPGSAPSPSPPPPAPTRKKVSERMLIISLNDGKHYAYMVGLDPTANGALWQLTPEEALRNVFEGHAHVGWNRAQLDAFRAGRKVPARE